MALEIKGLKLQAMTARGHLDRLSKAYAKFNEAAPAHAADVEGMAEQIGELSSDLEFATNLMGNSSAVLGNGPDEPAESIPRLAQAQPEPIVTQAKALNPLDLQYPNQPPPAVNVANPVMNHTPMARTVPSRRDL